MLGGLGMRALNAGRVFFTGPVVGAFPRTLHGKASDVASLLDFIPSHLHAAITAGADTTDLTTYIQEAIDATSAIYAPAGRYRHASAISLKKNFMLYGAGYGTHFSYTGSGVAFQAVGASLPEEWGTVLSNLRIVDAGTGTHGLRVKDIAEFEIDGVHVNGFGTAGIHLTGTAVTGACINIFVHDCIIKENAKGILADAVNNINHVALHSNRIQANTNHGVSIEVGGRAWSIVGCDIEGNANGAGSAELYISGGDAAGIDVSGCYFESSGAHAAIIAADAQALYGLSIHGCTFHANLATPNAIVLGVSAFVHGASVFSNSFAGSYTNAVSPGGVKGLLLGPNRLDGAIAHSAALGANSVGIQQIDENGLIRIRQGSQSRERVALAYSASMTPDAALANVFTIDVSNGVAFTINNPTNQTGSQQITLHIRNGSGGAMGAITWGSKFKLAGAFTNPANGQMRSITFTHDSGYDFWYETARAAADVPAT